MPYDLRVERLLTAGGQMLTLPELLASMATAGGEPTLDATPFHEQEPMHAFLVQLAALGLLHTGHRGLGPWATSPVFWQDTLLSLAGGVPEAFQLVVDDLRKPAFLQPSTSEPWGVFKRGEPFPDTISTLWAAKGHDVKRCAQRSSKPEHWISALVALQTTGGQHGRGRSGIVRMRHGGACRLTCVLVHSQSPGDRFRREVARLVQRHDQSGDRYGMPTSGGLALLWVEPWDGTLKSALRASLPKTSLDPLFIEVCSRVRLQEEGGQFVPYTTTSNGPRIDEGAMGQVGDPFGLENADGTLAAMGQSGWFPVDIGWSYEKVLDLLFGNLIPGIGFFPAEGEPVEPMLLYCSALPTVQQRAYRLLQQVLPLPAVAIRALLDTANTSLRDKLGRRGFRMAEMVVELQKSALVPALRTAIFPGNPWKSAYLIRHDWMVGRALFARLWDDVDLADETAVERWFDTIERLGTARLDTALRRCTLSTVARLEAVARATDQWRTRVLALRAASGIGSVTAQGATP